MEPDAEKKEEIKEAIAEKKEELAKEETTEAPAEEPTEAPAEEPTEAPAEVPTEAPAEVPTEAPKEKETKAADPYYYTYYDETEASTTPTPEDASETLKKIIATKQGFPAKGSQALKTLLTECKQFSQDLEILKMIFE